MLTQSQQGCGEKVYKINERGLISQPSPYQDGCVYFGSENSPFRELATREFDVKFSKPLIEKDRFFFSIKFEPSMRKFQLKDHPNCEGAYIKVEENEPYTLEENDCIFLPPGYKLIVTNTDTEQITITDETGTTNDYVKGCKIDIGADIDCIIKLDDKASSRKHCRIESLVSNKWTLTNLSKTNGTW